MPADGCVVEEGTHEELLVANGRYTQLHDTYRSQSRMSRWSAVGMARRSRAWPLRITLCGLATFGVYVALVSGFRSDGPDYLQFWVIGRAMPLDSYNRLHGKDIPIDRSDPAVADAVRAGQDALYLTATPLFYAVFARLSLADFASSLHLFQLASVVFFVGALIFMLRAWGYRWTHVCLVIAACCLVAAPFSNDTAHGNVSRVFVAMTAVVMWAFRRRSFIARVFGAQVLLALLVLFKPLLALTFPALLVLRIISGQWTHVAYETGGFVTGTLLGLLLPSVLVAAPLHLWRDFLGIQLQYVEHGDYEAPGLGDASLVEYVAATLHLSVFQLGALVALVCLATVAIILACVVARVRVRPSDVQADVNAADLAVWLGAAGFLLLSPLVWPHYYLLSIMLSLHLLRRMPEGDGARRFQAVALAGALALLAGYPSAPVSGLLGPGDALTADTVFGRQLVLGNLLVCGVGLAEYVRQFRHGRRRVPAVPLNTALS